MKFFIVLLISGAFLYIPVMVEARDQAKLLVEAANDLYSRKNLDQALEKYDLALTETFDPKIISVINFNKATVLYKKQDYARAIESFTKALATDDKRLEAKSSYNLGNAYYRLSELYADKSVDRAIELCEQSLYYYKLIIESGFRLPDAVYNYEYVKKKLDYYIIKKGLQDGRTAQRQKQGEEGNGHQQSQQKSQQENLQREHQSQKQSFEDEFQKKQEQLKQQHQGQQLQDELDRLNQQKQQQQSQLDDKLEKQRADKKALDSDGNLDYTKDEKPEVQEDPISRDRISKEEAGRLLDAYGRRERAIPAGTGIKSKTKEPSYKDW